jgi:hypothetical protein
MKKPADLELTPEAMHKMAEEAVKAVVDHIAALPYFITEIVSPSLMPTHFPEKVPADNLWQKIERTNKNRRYFLMLFWASPLFFSINLFF